MSNNNAPMGFKPLQRNDGAQSNFQLSPYKIQSGYATTICTYDIVKISGGYLNRAAAGNQWRGIFMGVQYTDATGRPHREPLWTASTATLGTQDATAWIIDDPNIEFEAQISAAATQADVGSTFSLAIGTQNTTIGVSGAYVDYTTKNTTALQFRLLRFIDRPDNDTASAYAKGVFSPALHDFRVNTGTA